MMTNIHFTTTGTAFGLPINDAIERIHASALELRAAAEKVRPGSEDFGLELVRATRAKLASRSGRAVIAENSESDFGEQIKQAVERKLSSLPSQKRHKERVERARERYNDPHRERVRSALAATLANH
jgi:hypothetical protein